MKKILYYLVPLATAFLLCGCLKDMKDGELLHGNREVLISIARRVGVARQVGVQGDYAQYEDRKYVYFRNGCEG